jgi:Plasmid pRiA4b ORF-3-like protein
VAQRGVAVTGTVYQLRVVLAGISPMVWRRLLVPAETSIAGLHEILQTAFGWSDEHLHRFTIHAVEYGLWRPGSAGFSRDARQVRLGEFEFRRGERFTYEYNFTAGWRHDIRVEEILPRSPCRRCPACTGGARQAPPEHFGSPEEFLALRQRWPPAIIAIRMAEIIAGLMDADGDAPASEVIGERRDELAGLLDLACLDKLDRPALNRALHALDLNPESVSDGRQQ